RRGSQLLLLLRQTGLRLTLQLGLPSRLLSLQTLDLAVDRREERLALAELALDRRPGRSALAHDLHLLRVRALQLALPLLDLASPGNDLFQDERDLLRDPGDRIHPAEHAVDARRAAQTHERRVLGARRAQDIAQASRGLR